MRWFHLSPLAAAEGELQAPSPRRATALASCRLLRVSALWSLVHKAGTSNTSSSHTPARMPGPAAGGMVRQDRATRGSARWDGGSGGHRSPGSISHRWRIIGKTLSIPREAEAVLGMAGDALTPASPSVCSGHARGTEVPAPGCHWSWFSVAAPASPCRGAAPLGERRRKARPVPQRQLRVQSVCRCVAARGTGVLWETTHSPDRVESRWHNKQHCNSCLTQSCALLAPTLNLFLP